MKLQILKKEGLQLPIQTHEGEDAAYDIVATTGPMIHGDKIERPIDGMPLWRRVVFIEYGTNLFVAPEEEKEIVWHKTIIGAEISPLNWDSLPISYHTQLWPRSSISKTNLVLANSIGLIDTGYRNQILCRFKYIFQPEDFVVIQEDVIRVYGMVKLEHLYNKGDKIIQIKAAPNVPISFELVDTLPTSQRGTKGFGSSGA